MKHMFFALCLLIMGMPASAQTSGQTADSFLRPVDKEYVCMVNDTLFDTPQIPVDAGEKNYYGCCMGCVSILQGDDRSARFATDPVSGNEVDKAIAIIGAAPDNSVYYFESHENLQQFKRSRTDSD